MPEAYRVRAVCGDYCTAQACSRLDMLGHYGNDLPNGNPSMRPASNVTTLLLMLVCTLPTHAPAQSAPPAGKAAASPQPAAPLARGEIVAIYPKDKKILIKHGPIPTLNMGPMTMEFEIANERMAKSLKKGDRVRFAAKRVGDDYVITRIELRK